MNDPHVENLRYRLVPLQTDACTVEYADPPPITFSTPDFDGHLQDGVLTLSLQSHYESVEDARATVDPYLAAWEVKTVLASDRPEVSFEYVDADIIDRDPPPPRQPGEPIVAQVKMAVELNMAASGSVEVRKSSYPSPPQDFVLDPETETLWHRYSGYVAGREPLQGMAYFCYSLVARDRERLGVSTNVIRKLRVLSSWTGDRLTARKVNYRPIEPEEEAWLIAAVKALIVRSGEVAASAEANRATLTLGDLPPLPRSADSGHVGGHEGREPA